MLRILVAALATAAERRLSNFNPQNVANTAWAFATANYRDEKLFAALAIAAEQRLSEFNPQEVANTAWVGICNSEVPRRDGICRPGESGVAAPE